MTTSRDRAGLAALVFLIAGMAGLLGFYLNHTQARAREGLARDFATRAHTAAAYTASALGATPADELRSDERQFGGAEPGLQARAEAYRTRFGYARVVVADASGRILATAPPSYPPRRGTVTGARYLRPSARGGTAVSDLLRLPNGLDVDIALTLRTAQGVRVLAAVASADEIADFATGFLAGAPAVKGARAYLLDGTGRVLAAPGGVERQGDLPRDRAVRTAAGDADAAGRRYAASPVSHTAWRVVFSAPRHALYAPVEGSVGASRRVVFGAFLAALLLAAGLATRVLRRTRQLAGARAAEAAAEERERAASELAHERLHDPLTRLPNRALFHDRCTTVIAAAGRLDRTVAVMFVDVDRFKRINDWLGHGAGDDLLRAVAARLRGVLRPHDTVSRYGGDEFLAVFEVPDAEHGLRVAERARRAVAAPFSLSGREVEVRVSIGVALRQPALAAATPESLIGEADAAMYRVKQRGGNRVTVFDDRLHRRALDSLETELALRSAVAQDELRLVYQPIVAAATGRLGGAEALVRWERAEHGTMQPAEFIPMAEETGLIGEIGAWVLERACQDLAAWTRAGEVPDDFHVSVNLSPRQLADANIVSIVSGTLERSGIGPERLWLEVTETALMGSLDALVVRLENLRALGVTMAMDDFGTGHSSLSHIARMLPIDVLKLDRSFVIDMHGERERAIVASIASLGRALGLVTLAEGVETPDRADDLAAMGFDLAQGFHFGRPMPAAELAALLGRRPPEHASAS